MSDPVFRSRLKEDLEAFLVQKRAAGYPYHTSASVLGYLDNMIAEHYPDSTYLSKEICDSWIERCSKLHQNTLLTVPNMIVHVLLINILCLACWYLPAKMPQKGIR